MKRAVRIIRRLLDLALIVLVVAVLAIALAANLGPGLGHDPVVIRGGSMSPTIPMGAVVDVVHVAPADLRAGDIVTLRASQDVLETLRITRVVQQPDGLYIETKGDANGIPDPVLWPASAVVGRVDFAIPGVGYLMYMLTIPTGILSILGLALTMLLAIWLLQDSQEEQDRQDEEPVPYEMPGLLALLPPTSDLPPHTNERIG